MIILLKLIYYYFFEAMITTSASFALAHELSSVIQTIMYFMCQKAKGALVRMDLCLFE